jgi:hypothetical protein
MATSSLSLSHRGNEPPTLGELLHKIDPAPRPSAVINTLAKQSALNAIKARLRAQGIGPNHFTLRELSAQARDYLDQHCAELFAETWERVKRSPELRELYDKDQRNAKQPDPQRELLCRTHGQNGEPK